MAGIAPSLSAAGIAGMTGAAISGAGTTAGLAGLSGAAEEAQLASGNAETSMGAPHPFVKRTSYAQRFAKTAFAYAPTLGIAAAAVAALYFRDWSGLGYLAMSIPPLVDPGQAGAAVSAPATDTQEDTGQRDRAEDSRKAYAVMDIYVQSGAFDVKCTRDFLSGWTKSLIQDYYGSGSKYPKSELWVAIDLDSDLMGAIDLIAPRGHVAYSSYLIQIEPDANIKLVAKAGQAVTPEHEQLLQYFADHSRHPVQLYTTDAPYRRDFMPRSPVRSHFTADSGLRYFTPGMGLYELMEPGVPVVLVSLPRMGKTTLAESIHSQFNDGEGVVHTAIDLRNSTSYPDVASFLDAEVRRIALGIQMDQQIDDSIQLSDGSDPLRALNTWLAKHNLNAVITFDETVARQAYRELAPRLYGLGRVYSIVVLHRSPSVMADMATVFPKGRALVRTIGFMSREEMEYMLKGEGRLQLTADQVDRLYQLSGGHVQTVTTLMWHMNNLSSDMEQEIVDRLATDLIRPHDFSEDENRILYQVAEGNVINASACPPQVLEGLLSLGLITVTDDGVLHISGELVRRAIVKSLK